MSAETYAERSARERGNLRRELRRFDTIFFLISAMVVVDTIGAIAIGGAQAFTWLIVLFLFFFVPSALASAELGSALPEEGGAYVWVRRSFGRFAAGVTSLLYWAGTPMWLGGSVTVVAIAVWGRFFGELSRPGMFLFGTVFIVVATVGAIVPLHVGKWVPTTGAIGQIALLVFFTVSVAIYGGRHGIHGITAGDFAPSYLVFIASIRPCSEVTWAAGRTSSTARMGTAYMSSCPTPARPIAAGMSRRGSTISSAADVGSSMPTNE